MRSATLIQQARRRSGLTQTELAGKVGTTQSAVARWERGASRPTVERLQSLVEACGLELQIGLAPSNGEELAALRRNLALTVDERVQRVVQLRRFVEAGRDAMASSRPKR
jgi:transcriptional regulator with XRE-family HTH domain